jgi:L-threonylcarbamoyladenylate synthase
VHRYAENIPGKAKDLAEAFWPGPLTLLLKKKSIIPDLVTAGLPTVGIRCPDHPLTRELLAALAFPLAAPSANPFGYVSPTTPKHVADQLGDKIPYILDGGPCQVGLESTIIGFHNGMGMIHRTGGLKIEEIEEVIGNVRLNIAATASPKTPGQLHSHYAPAKKLIAGNIEELIGQFPAEKTGILSFQKNFQAPLQVILSPSGSLEEAARNLFAALRTLDESPAEIIIAEYVPDTGLGKAINDRLRRATATTPHS